MALFPCENAFNCLDVNDGVVRECFTKLIEGEELSFCECSNQFGWEGETCNEPTGTVYYIGVSIIIFFIIYLSLIIYGTRLLYVFVKIQFFGPRTRDSINPVFYVIITELLAAVMIFTNILLRLFPIFDSNAFVVSEERSLLDNEERIFVERTNEKQAKILFATGTCLQVMASIVIILSWFDVLVFITDLFPQEEFWSERKIRIILISIISFSFIVTMSLAIAKYETELFLCFALLALCNSIAYSVGYFYFTKKMKQFTQTLMPSRTTKGIILIKRCFQVNLSGSAVIFTSSIIYGLFFDSFFSTAEPGTFNYLNVLLDFSLVALVFIMAFTFWYSKEVTLNLFSKEIKQQSYTKTLFPEFCKNNKKAKGGDSSDDLGVIELNTDIL